MATVRKTGPLTSSELISLWKSVVDESYSRPFIEGEAEGRDTGFEASVGQASAQIARASEMVNRSTQSMYVLPWSGQTEEPASGARYATVTLTMTRTAYFTHPLTIVEGDVFFIEQVDDFGPDGAQTVLTGRRFVAAETKTFAPGEEGPIDILARAERPGFGYNLPPEGAITGIDQVGASFGNERAKVVGGVESHRLIVRPTPDVVIHQHVGSFVQFTAGANAGQVRRIIGYERPSATYPHGGVAVLVASAALFVSGVVGTFTEGEEVTQTVLGTIVAKGIFRRLHGITMVVERTFGTFATATVIVGVLSGASAVVDVVDISPDMTSEAPDVPAGSNGASWVVLSWSTLGLSVTNAASPTGGVAPMLDELGEERAIYRAPGEVDDSYRKRIAKVADTVSPNAIRRIANRIFATYGASACLRETGKPELRGFFFDGDPSNNDPAIAFAYDFDFTTRPQDRYKLIMDYTEMRAFFVLGVPKLPLPEFGFAYDEGLINAYDSTPWLSFYDGFPITTAILYRTAWQAIEKARAYGVGFDLMIDDSPCS
jgi:hypothetical protein